MGAELGDVGDFSVARPRRKKKQTLMIPCDVTFLPTFKTAL